MMNLETCGWNLRDIGELDHREVKAPYIRMIAQKNGKNGDVVFSYDFRFTQPNQSYMTTRVLHSLEHYLLVGFRKYLKDSFISVSPMGCQTGFYLILLNECDYKTIATAFKKVLEDITESEEVPLSTEIDCGQAEHHTLEESKILARSILEKENQWAIVQ